MTGSANPAVTVVVPTHARPELMRRAVESVVDQAYAGEIEVIVVFDACEPELPDVVVGPARRLRGVVNDRTRGLAGARNSGILAASHGLVAFLDDDDRWLPTKLSAQVDLLASRPDTVLVGTAMEIDAGTHRRIRLTPSSSITYADLLRHRIPGLHSSSFVVRREALLGALGLVDEQIPKSYGEDYDLLLRAAALAPVAVVNEPLVEVRWQGESHFVGWWEDYASSLRYLLAKHPALRTDRRGLARIETQLAFSLAAAGHRGESLRWVARALRHHPWQPKAMLAVAVAIGILSPDRVVRLLRRYGRGV